MGRKRFSRVRWASVWMTIAFIVGALWAFEAAWAHKVNVFAYAEGGTVFVESYFPDGSPVVKGGVRVTDAQGKQVFEGSTDEQGRAQFKAPQEKTDLTIEVTASMGHRAVFTLKKSDM